MSSVLTATQQSGEPRLDGSEAREDPLSPQQGHPCGDKMSWWANILQNQPQGTALERWQSERAVAHPGQQDQAGPRPVQSFQHHL